MNAAKVQPVDWSGVKLEMARQIFEQGEKVLQAQLEIALASDQRATAIASLFAAVGTAVAAGAFTYWDKNSDTPILAAGIVTSVVMIMGALRSLWAARPVPFHTPGNHPNRWYSCKDEDLAPMLGAEAESYQTMIDQNESQLRANSRAIMQGATIAVSSPIVGIALWLGLKFIFSSS